LRQGQGGAGQNAGRGFLSFKPWDQRKGADNDEEHHRDQHDRSQQDGGHRTNRTPATSLVAGLASADAQHVATAVDHSGNAGHGEGAHE